MEEWGNKEEVNTIRLEQAITRAGKAKTRMK